MLDDHTSGFACVSPLAPNQILNFTLLLRILQHLVSWLKSFWNLKHAYDVITTNIWVPFGHGSGDDNIGWLMNPSLWSGHKYLKKKLFDGFLGNWVQTFMFLRGRRLVTLVIFPLVPPEGQSVYISWEISQHVLEEFGMVYFGEL